MLNTPTTPCVDCNTRFGYIAPGRTLPERTRGLCTECRRYHERKGTLHQFERTAQYHDRHMPRKPQKVRPAWMQREENQERIAARVARHESGYAEAVPVVEGDEFNHWQERDNADRTAAAWIDAHPQQLLATFYSTIYPGWPSNTEGLQAFSVRREPAA